MILVQRNSSIKPIPQLYTHRKMLIPTVTLQKKSHGKSYRRAVHESGVALVMRILEAAPARPRQRFALRMGRAASRYRARASGTTSSGPSKSRSLASERARDRERAVGRVRQANRAPRWNDTEKRTPT